MLHMAQRTSTGFAAQFRVMLWLMTQFACVFRRFGDCGSVFSSFLLQSKNISISLARDSNWPSERACASMCVCVFALWLTQLLEPFHRQMGQNHSKTMTYLTFKCSQNKEMAIFLHERPLFADNHDCADLCFECTHLSASG